MDQLDYMLTEETENDKAELDFALQAAEDYDLLRKEDYTELGSYGGEDPEDGYDILGPEEDREKEKKKKEDKEPLISSDPLTQFFLEDIDQVDKVIKKKPRKGRKRKEMKQIETYSEIIEVLKHPFMENYGQQWDSKRYGKRIDNEGEEYELIEPEMQDYRVKENEQESVETAFTKN